MAENVVDFVVISGLSYSLVVRELLPEVLELVIKPTGALWG